MVRKMQLDHLAKRTERLRSEIASAGGDDGGCGDRSDGIIVLLVEGRRPRYYGGRFAVLILLTVKAYQNAPPIPERFVNPANGVVFTADDVIAGQQVFSKHGLMDNGTIWGHGGYLGPDFSAQSLHLLALYLGAARGS
jgi:hypothetical protein